ncbi:uncharacterized protein LOC119434118 isoform X6 [Dermacentor silvarum]|uniref:uncharacterized protein LOC119434118 isoform X3 n=1 Tax=Dermacentor silvarum TaxID=543639 RepID=UPI0021010032|nr:uncharacterized protein LOC119434118 isoform X3 [Dermacentor silvarum]XP_049514148.1 uncharacterized protein LOC119434118 isoform X6 [Dermacentor silvarum]
MVALAGILGAWLTLAACCRAATTETELPRPAGACDETSLAASLRECDAKFGPASAHDIELKAKTVCSAVGEYKACLLKLTRVSGCGDAPPLARRLQRMDKFVQEQLPCVAHANVSSQLVMEAPLANRDACAKHEVWNKQFLCARSFHAEVEELQEHRGDQSNEICRAVERYRSCLDAALHGESCDEDAELGRHAKYFRNVLTFKYSDLCPAELGLPALKPRVKVLRAMGAASGSSAEQSCQEEKATKEFFACGLLFNVIVSKSSPKERICKAYKNMEKCTRDLQCANAAATFNVHSMRVMDVLLSPYDKYCRGFVGSDMMNRTVPPPPAPTTPPVCDEELYLQQYFECGLMYMFGLPGANETEFMTNTSLICALIDRHKVCVDNARKISNCPNGIPVQNNLDYFDNELRKAPKEKCSALAAKRNARRRFRSSTVPRCHLREYAGTYFTCATVFLAATFPDPPAVDELCRLLAEFKKCVASLIPCRTDSDLTPRLDFFSSVLTEGYAESCKGRNISGFCDRFILLKDFFSCGMTYYQAHDEFGRSYLLTKQHSCKLIEDYGKCVYEKVLKNSCEALKELFSNIRDVRNYIVKVFNKKHKVSCSLPAGMQRQRGPVPARQSSCDEFAAVRKLLLCGVSFHRMLPASSPAQNGSSSSELAKVDDGETAALCPLVKEMKYCMYSATKDSGCAESLFFNTEVSLLRRRLLAEFEGVCDDTLPWNESSTDSTRNRQGCELKEFTQEWETCEAARANKVAHKYRNGTGPPGRATMSERPRTRFCSDISGFLRCLRDSAGRHHCPALAPGESNSGHNELFERLGYMACSSSACSPLGNRWALKLVVLAGSARFVARQPPGWR